MWTTHALTLTRTWKFYMYRVYVKGRKLNIVEVEIYKHTKTGGRNILHDQTQFKLHIGLLFEHFTTAILISNHSAVTKNRTDSADEARNDRKLVQAMGNIFKYSKILVFRLY